MVRGARYLYASVAWAFVAGLVVQVYLIGLGLFGDSSFREVHRNVGYLLQIVPLVVVIAAAVGRVGRTRILAAVGLTVLVIVFPIFPVLRDVPVVAALHPVGALVAFWLAIVVARQASDSLREADPATERSEVPAAG
jgi:uncharacterized protein DUF6220